MSYIPMKQPDGQWCVFGTITDSFMLEDATRAEVQKFLFDIERDRINDRLDHVEDGTYPRRLSYEKAQSLTETTKNSTEDTEE